MKASDGLIIVLASGTRASLVCSASPRAVGSCSVENRQETHRQRHSTRSAADERRRLGEWPASAGAVGHGHLEWDRRGVVRMSDLIAVGFKGEHTADQVLNKLQALQKEYLI